MRIEEVYSCIDTHTYTYVTILKEKTVGKAEQRMSGWKVTE